MSKSKGNELLQELYARLKGLWEHKGKYAGQSLPQSEVKDLLKRIIKEYDTDTETTNTINKCE